jgi:tRNA-splicing ligase RtcB (3'-phosphate/5'-hydroxy nucleic acid ligase)
VGTATPRQRGGSDLITTASTGGRKIDPAQELGNRKIPSGTAFASVGQAVLVPGAHRTSFYLCAAAAGAEWSFHSACHGAGTIIDQFARHDVSGPCERGHMTLRFRYKENKATVVPHLDDRGVDEAVGILVAHDLVRPVARLRPLAVLH